MSVISFLKNKYSNEDLEQIIKDLHIFMAAGFNTLTGQTSNITYFLHQYPKVFEKLWSEIDATLSSDLWNLNKDTIEKMDYLNWFIKEA